MTPKQKNSVQQAWVQLYMARRSTAPIYPNTSSWSTTSASGFFLTLPDRPGSTQDHATKAGAVCGLTHVRVHQLLKDPGHLTWFVRSRLGSISDRYGPRSEPTTYWVRAEIPLTLVGQARLVTCL